jgi:hypothetical protein
VVLGRYPSIPSVFSESLNRVIAVLLKVNPRERPTAVQALAMPEIQEKIFSFQAIQKAKPEIENLLLNTIKVPQALRKLNDVLPKPCYPELVSPRISHAIPPIPEEGKIPMSARSDASCPVVKMSARSSMSDQKENHVQPTAAPPLSLAPLAQLPHSAYPSSVSPRPPLVVRHPHPPPKPTSNNSNIHHRIYSNYVR